MIILHKKPIMQKHLHFLSCRCFPFFSPPGVPVRVHGSVCGRSIGCELRFVCVCEIDADIYPDRSARKILHKYIYKYLESVYNVRV